MSTMSKNKKNVSQKGGAIIYMMAVGAVIATLGYYLLSLSHLQNKEIVRDRAISSYWHLIKSVQLKLDNPYVCTTVLSGLDVTSAFTPAGQSIVLNLSLGTSPAPIQNGWKSVEGTTVQKILLKISPTPVRAKVRRDVAAPLNLTAADAEIWIYPDNKGPVVSTTSKELIIPIMIYYEIVGAQKFIRNCFGKYSEAALCTNEGGAFNGDPAVLPELRCEPDIACLNQKNGILNNSTSCTLPYKPYSVGPNLFMCLWCNQNVMP
jgi:hypothetical protein